MYYQDSDKPKGKVVLLVEDSLTQAMGTQLELEGAGVKVICAINGIMGIRLAYQVMPDAIVLDVQMPDINGFEVCAELKKDPETAKIPIIMLTRQDTPEAFQSGLKAGAIDYIPKDAFAMVVLKETLRQMGIIESPPSDTKDLPQAE